MTPPRNSRDPRRGRLYSIGLGIALIALVTSAGSALYLTAGGSFAGLGADALGIASSGARLEADSAKVAAEAVDSTLQRARESAWAGRHDDALPAYDSVLARRPHDREVALERARVMGWAEEYGRAADALAALPGSLDGSVEPDPEIAMQRARFLWWAGRSREADSLLSVVLTHRPDVQGAAELQALVRPTVEPAVDVATRWVEERPDDPWSNLWLARALVDTARNAEALRHYGRALAEPGAVEPEVLLEAAGVALGVDSLAFAGRTLERYLRVADPSDWETRLRLARAYAWSGRYDAADEQYRIVLRHRPHDHALRLERARYLWSSGRAEPADAELSRLLAAAPDHTEARALRAEVRPSIEPSIELATEWLAAEESVENRLRVARLLVADGRPGRALDHYDVVLADATDRSLVTEAADAAHAADAPARVIAILERHVAAVDQPDPDVLLRLARVYSWDDRPADAVRVYADYLSARPDHVDARLERGRLLAWGDDAWHDEARAELERVVAADPSRADAAELLADLERWSGERAQAVAASAETLPDVTRVAWAAELEAFSDTEGFDWIGSSVRREWALGTASVALRLGHGYSRGRPVAGAALGSTGFGAGLGARLPLAPGLSALGELGAMSYQDADEFLTWGAGLEYETAASMAGFRYSRAPAVRDAATMAALQAGAVMDRLRVEAGHQRGPWGAAADFQLQRFGAALGDADRYAGMVRLDRQLGESGLAVGGIVRGITATGRAPFLPDWGRLYWTPDHYIAPALSLRYGATIAEGLWLGLRAAPGIAFIDEGDGASRYDHHRAAILEAGGSLGYRTGPWRLELSGDWGGVPTGGYNASALTFRLSRFGGSP